MKTRIDEPPAIWPTSTVAEWRYIKLTAYAPKPARPRNTDWLPTRRQGRWGDQSVTYEPARKSVTTLIVGETLTALHL